VESQESRKAVTGGGRRVSREGGAGDHEEGRCGCLVFRSEGEAEWDLRMREPERLKRRRTGKDWPLGRVREPERKGKL
jgi:hypothetical protein